ncbi:MAG: PIG-L deacetylase family protein [Pseudomonadota bacterium]
MDILVVAAHPDDEVLGCGATMARHAREGDRVHVLIVAEGATSRADRRDADAASDQLESLRAAARAAARCLGTEEPRFAGLPDNRLDAMDLLDLIKVVERAVADIGPAVVYTHHAGDLNIDHRLVHQAVLTACRPLPGGTVRIIRSFETPSSTEWAGPGADVAFLPNRFVDVSDTLDAKMAALDCYASEMRSFPHARSAEAVTALARWRGASAGMAAAEAFMVLRELEV